VLPVRFLQDVWRFTGLRTGPFKATFTGLVAVCLLTAAAEGKQARELLNQAQLAMDSGRLEEAASSLFEVLDINPDNRDARVALVDILMRLKRQDEAEAEIATLRKKFPRDSQIAYFAAAVAYSKGDFETAGQLAGESIELPDTPSQAYKIRAFSRYMTKDDEGFKADLEKLIDREPDNPEAYYHLGRYYYESQQFTEAITHFEKATNLEPTAYRAHYFLGWCQQAQGDLTSAKESYRRAIKIIDQQRVQYGWPFTDLGDLLITEGEYESGLGWHYRAIRNDPQFPYGHYKYASALMKEGASAEVEQQLQLAIQLDPGYTEAYYLLGRYYQGIGEQDKAKEAFAKFQELRKNPQASPYGVRRER
jgi:tetratricopeptide (TPR) repeat protein